MMLIKRHKIRLANQQGGALILFVLILVIAGTTALFSVLDSKSLKIERDKQTAAMLAEAKALLIGYTLDRVNVGTRPGSMPLPDRLLMPTESGGAPNYDGSTDSCVTAGVGVATKIYCLGRFPWKTLGMAIDSPSENDSVGQMPWYVVSANLTDVCLKELNSNILNYDYPGTYPPGCPGVPVSAAVLGQLPHPWLTVRDKLGNILSSRVAAIIIIPGAVVGVQSRPASPNLGAENQYLDTVTVLPACALPCIAGTYSNADLDNDFIKADDISTVLAVDPSYQQPYVFNDKLIYITIDDLMATVEKRAAQEAASQLRKYYITSSATLANRFYPYAATLGDVNNACVNLSMSGLLPITPAQATCTSATVCSVSFPMTEVNFTRTVAAPYTSDSAACTRIGNICTCTGAGSCVKSGGAGTTFSCNSSGVCSSTGISPNGSFSFTYVPKLPETITGTCSGGAGNVVCSSVGSFSSPETTCTYPNPGLSNLPVWFTDNLWQDFIYYAVSSDCANTTPGCINPAVGLTVGMKNNIDAVVISAGETLTGQARLPAATIPDYLDKASPSPYGATLFDAVGTPKSSAYNDQMFIVAPQ
ncbi:MAG: hypothetical protein U1C48_04060 [Methylotenera sp.]|nr:hypothetical protein [Methylotenera sp.]